MIPSAWAIRPPADVGLFPRLAGRKRKPRRGRTWLRGVLAAAFLLLIADGIYLARIWPDWEPLARGAIPKSRFIHRYEAARAQDPALPPLRWRPVSLARIAPVMRRVVVVAEDSRFWRHAGVDTVALRGAMEYNLEHGRVAYGASTISQQTAKNLFLSDARDPLRKWHELLLTLAMERKLRKARILEIYLNVAEFGPGVFGVEAAARLYFGVTAAELAPDQAVSLAASLPSPKLHNPATATRTWEKRRERIGRHLTTLGRRS
ncbi:MAG: monofunctional biosynthetic peptidoglycan transglycosylase [Thiohalomonadaceae bacterium]